MPDAKKEKKPAAPPSAVLKTKKKKLSVIKRARQDKKKREHNYSIKVGIKDSLKKVNAAIKEKNKEKAIQSYRLAVSALDKAALKGVIHKNKASRHKSILAKRIHKLSAA